MKTEICERLGIEFPIFAFSHCRDVVAAVSRAGGLGVLGAVAYSPEQLELELKWIDEHVDGKPYGVDTVIPAKYIGKDQGDITKEQLDQMITPAHRKWINDLLDRNGVPPLPDDVEEIEGLLGWSASGGRAHFEVAMNHPIALIANALGPPPEDIISQAHDKGVMVAALCGTVRQAIKQKTAGVDIVIASGYEAGGHTGEIGSMVLLPQVVDAVAPTPVLGAGGIGSGRQMAAAMAMGAAGVWDRLDLAHHRGVRLDSIARRQAIGRRFDRDGALALHQRQTRPSAQDSLHACVGRGPGVSGLPADASSVHGHSRSYATHYALRADGRRGFGFTPRNARGSGRRPDEHAQACASGHRRNGWRVHRRGRAGLRPALRFGLTHRDHLHCRLTSRTRFASLPVRFAFK